MWIAVEPVFSEAQLTRALLAARYADIPVTIVLNKVDLPGADTARQRLAPYVAMGYDVVEMSLKVDTDAAKAQVMPLLQGKASLVLGPSGAGKSTLINTLLPNARAEVGEISQALNSGRHTTTTSLWYWLDDSHESAVIDSPGFQEFGLHHIAPTELAKLDARHRRPHRRLSFLQLHPPARTRLCGAGRRRTRRDQRHAPEPVHRPV
jgi:ribosome biogenesis GTPase